MSPYIPSARWDEWKRYSPSSWKLKTKWVQAHSIAAHIIKNVIKYVYSRVSTNCPATGTDNSKPLIPVSFRKTRPSSNYKQLMSLQLTPLSPTLILYLSFSFLFLSDRLPRDLPPPQLFIVCCNKIKLAPQKKHVELRDLFKIFVT